MSFKVEVAKGAFWIAIAKYSGIVVQIFITAILARLISPAAFGTIAVALVVIQFLNILADIGIGPAVVQFKELTNHHLNSLFTLNIYIGMFFALALFFSANLISSYYGDVMLERVCQMLALVVFFNSLNVVPGALMRKGKRFRAIALRTLFFQILSGSVAVWIAYNGGGIYALLISPILTAIGVFLVNYFNYPLKYVIRINKEAVNIVASFSVFQFAFSFFNYFSRNLDKLIIGKYFSLTQLGYYDKSYHLMLLPLQNITFVVEPVLHPILSSLQNNRQDIGMKNIQLSKFLSYISFPLGIILFTCGGEIIRIIYGNQWDAAIPVFKILALSLPLQMIQSTSGAIYQAAGKTNHMFYNGIINTVITVSGFFLAAYCYGTIESMAWAWVLTLLINFLNSYWILYHYTIKDSVLPFFKAIVAQLLNSLCVLLLLSVFSVFIGETNDVVSLCWKVFFTFVLTINIAKILGQYNIYRIVKSIYNK